MKRRGASWHEGWQCLGLFRMAGLQGVNGQDWRVTRVLSHEKEAVGSSRGACVLFQVLGVTHFSKNVTEVQIRFTFRKLEMVVF